MIHTLKIDDYHLDNLILGNKKCEIRFNDRNYKLNEYLMFDRNNNHYIFKITHIDVYEQKENYVVLSVDFVKKL